MSTEQLSLDALRSIVQDSLGKHLYENAIFFADKLVTLSQSADDVYRLAQALLFTKQFRRALHVLRTTGQATAESRFRYLTAKCFAECQEWDECLSTLSDEALAAVQVRRASAVTGETRLREVASRSQGAVQGAAAQSLRRSDACTTPGLPP